MKKKYLYNVFGLSLIYIGVLLQILSFFQTQTKSGYKNVCIIAGEGFILIGFITYLRFKKKHY